MRRFLPALTLVVWAVSGCMPALEDECQWDEDCLDPQRPRCEAQICVRGLVTDAAPIDLAVAQDIGAPDAEPPDAEPQDAEPQDAEPQDAEPQDAEPQDAEPQDAELPCADRPERCGDQIDNNCNNSVDEGFGALGDACQVGVGQCQTEGVEVCSDDRLTLRCEVLNAQSPQEEICDGVDNDCDGRTDEDIAEQPCGDVEEYCEVGVQTCTQGHWSVCSAVPRPESNTFCDRDAEGVCAQGLLVCANGANGTLCASVEVATPETCDGLDNDCDGQVDEGDLCLSPLNASGQCLEAACAYTCEAGWFGAPPVEGCARGCPVEDEHRASFETAAHDLAVAGDAVVYVEGNSLKFERIGRAPVLFAPNGQWRDVSMVTAGGMFYVGARRSEQVGLFRIDAAGEVSGSLASRPSPGAPRVALIGSPDDIATPVMVFTRIVSEDSDEGVLFGGWGDYYEVIAWTAHGALSHLLNLRGPSSLSSAMPGLIGHGAMTYAALPISMGGVERLAWVRLSLSAPNGLVQWDAHVLGLTDLGPPLGSVARTSVAFYGEVLGAAIETGDANEGVTPRVQVLVSDGQWLGHVVAAADLTTRMNIVSSGAGLVLYTDSPDGVVGRTLLETEAGWSAPISRVVVSNCALRDADAVRVACVQDDETVTAESGCN